MTASLALVERYAAARPDGMARHLEGLAPEALSTVIAELSSEGGAALVPHLAPSSAARALASLPAEAAAALARHLPLEVLSTLLRRMAPETSAALLEVLPPADLRAVRALLSYDPATAGGVMDPQVLVVPVASTAAETRALIATDPSHLYYYLYAVDAEHRLAGVFDIAELMQADAAQPVRALLKSRVVWLSAEAPLESVFAHPGWREFDALPVVDGERRLLGVIRHRRMRQLLEANRPHGGEDRTVRTVLALGEIYWLGLCGLLQGIATTATSPQATGDEA